MIGPSAVNRKELLNWAGTIAARSELPRLLRRLILETGRGVVQLGFPAGEGVALGGWDGTLVSAEAGPFIPVGLSVWELTVEESVGTKADRDFKNRKTTPDGSPTSTCTYVAAALRPFRDRKTWAAGRRAQGIWKDVWALGVDEIETWLEHAPITQAWISQVLGRNPYGLRPVDLWWDGWASATTPNLTPQLMLAGRSSQQEALIQRLREPAQVTTIRGGSLDELQSFIAAVLIEAANGGDDRLKARAAFVDDLLTWRALVARPNPLILVPTTDEVRNDTTPAPDHHIVIPLIDAPTADIELPAIDADDAAAALAASGLDEPKARKLARLGRRSLLTMRRELANKPELHQPAWAKPPADRVTRALLLAGRWRGDVTGDRQVLADLAGRDYSDLRERIAELAVQADPLIGGVGDVWALVSAFDAWTQLVRLIQRDDLERLAPTVQTVLGEVDPSLELPRESRWRAAIDGKVRRYSPELRRGLASTLTLLGVHGEHIDADSIGNGADWAALAVDRLLREANADSTCDTWISLGDVLTLLAEAAPDAFLGAVDRGLEGEAPLLAGLFVEEEDPLGGSNSYHTSMLWALETVVWSEQHFGQTVDTLARLAEIDPGGRLANRPAASLAAIFSPWHPDNSVDVSRRLAALDTMRRRHAEVAWSLMLTMLPKGHQVHFPSNEPAYRTWKPAKITVTYAEYYRVITEVVHRLVRDAGSDATRWAQLVDTISDLTSADRSTVLEALRVQIGTGGFSDDDRPRLWESLRSLTARHREYSDADWALPSEELSKIDEVGTSLQPTAPQQRDAWLFQSYRPALPGISLRDDHRAYEAALTEHRKEAVADIDAAGGLGALQQLAHEAEQAWWVGVAIADASEAKYEDELLNLLGADDRVEADLGASYAARRFDRDGWTWVEDVLQRFASLSAVQRAIILVQTRDYPMAWERADSLGQDVAREFWKQFGPYGLGNFQQAADAAERLIGVERNAAALSLIELYVKRNGSDTVRLLDLAATALRTLLTRKDSEFGNLSQYDFQQLFELFYEHRDALGWERIAHLEWAYLPALGYNAKPRMLNDLMARDPDFFVEVVSAAFRPSSSEERPEPTEQEARRAANAYRLLNEWSKPPGTRDTGEIDGAALTEWVTRAVSRLREVDRLTIGLQQIGEVLSQALPDSDGKRPPLAVRELIEAQRSAALDEGCYIGTVNARGVVSRSLSDGGDQERALVTKYRGYADAYADEWPRTAAIMRAVAESYERQARREDQDAERFQSGLDE
jgi:hypothetical protein